MLARETTAAKKPSIYEYPREVKRIRDTLVQFLVDVFLSESAAARSGAPRFLFHRDAACVRLHADRGSR